MTKLDTKKKLPHIWTETLFDFVEIEKYIKKLEFENSMMRELFLKNLIN